MEDVDGPEESDKETNYIKIGNAEWMPRYDSDGNIMVTITTEETE